MFTVKLQGREPDEGDRKQAIADPNVTILLIVVLLTLNQTSHKLLSIILHD